MTTFSPVAIVGRSCVLPGALSPGDFWNALIGRKDLLSPVPLQYWRVPLEQVLCSPDDWTEGKIWSDRGGYVHGFQTVFEPAGFARPASDILELDVQIHWLLHTAREVLREVGIYRGGDLLRERVGLIFGNLGYPTFALSEYAEALTAERFGPTPDPRNRFHPGLSGPYVAECLGLTGEAWCLDAACASSLYALKLACDRLHDGEAEFMLAGAVNRCDDLAIHAGFCSLRALSPTGQSRPFHRRADGLVPAEGAALFALMRLDDAIARDLRILGVIRGIGLSNDGRAGGFLSPSGKGQAQALEKAYAMSGLEPGEVSYLECHATGTPGGDSAELEMLARFFHDAAILRIGSHKSNVGHLITTAGAAGLLKLLSSFEHGMLAPHRQADDLMPQAERPPLRVVTEVEAWRTSGVRRAGLNAFGFGGTNAHLIVEEWSKPSGFAARSTRERAPSRIIHRSGEVAVVRVAVRAGGAENTHEFERLLFGARCGVRSTRIDEISVDPRKLSFPPRDLEKTLPQQLLILETVLEAARGCVLPASETGVFVGAGCDAAACRWTVSMRSTAGFPGAAESVPAFNESYGAAWVIGAMLNIAANRINFQLDLRGPGFTCFAEELSGVRALGTAVRMIRQGELEAAIVGAVDLAVEDIHAVAAQHLLPENRQEPGDAAVALVLKPLEDAQRDGDAIAAVIGDDELPADDGTPVLRLSLDSENPGLTPLTGHAHAASGLLLVASAVVALQHRLLPTLDGQPAWSWLGFSNPRRAAVRATGLGGQTALVWLREFDPRAGVMRDLYLPDRPRIYAFSGETREDVFRALEEGGASRTGGPCRLAFVATDPELESTTKEAADRLSQPGRSGSGSVFFREQPIGGSPALFCSSAVGVYAGQGREVYRAFNQLVHEDWPGRHPAASIARAQTRWSDPYHGGEAGAFDRLAGARMLSRIHGRIAKDVFRLRYDAAMGLSSGETDVMFTVSAADMNESLRQAEIATRENLFTEVLSGGYDCVRQAWGLSADDDVHWSMWRVIGPPRRAIEALGSEPRAHVAIINAPTDFVLAGDRSVCLRILEEVGPVSFLEIEGYDLAYHVPEVAHGRSVAIFHDLYASDWRPPPRVRIYSSAWAAPYVPSGNRYAEAMIAQATRTVDLPALVDRAYEDGVRIFVEVGPRNLSAGWIREILGDRPHLAVSFNRRGSNDLRQIALAAAELFSAGVDLDIDAWNARMEELEHGSRMSPAPEREELNVPAHSEFAVLARERAAIMPPAPPLPPVLSAYGGDLDDEASQDFSGAMLSGGALPALEGEPLRSAIAARSEAHARAAYLRESIARQSEAFLNYTRTATEAHLGFLRLRARMRRSLLLDPAPPGGESHTRNGLEAAPVARGATQDAPVVRDSVVRLEPRPPKGPSYGREQLLLLASGRVSEVFGPMFEQQDGYRRQTRLPEPPLLLVDRITGLDAKPGVHGTGTIWTETDVRLDSWYLHHGRMPGGIMVEAGQADLALISYMGTDFRNRGERVYRLLGCQLTYHRGLARAGDTLKYQIEVESHVEHGDIRMFFFNYDCTIDEQLAMTVRRGHAGFFTDEELAESDGVLWDPETSTYDEGARLDPPAVACRARAFDEERIRAFFEGRMFDCFGAGFERTLTHTRTPQPGSGLMRFFHEIPVFDPTGGPWERGYLRARWTFTAEDWFLACHFKNDPCMPGTLMLEGAFQAMAFYLTALGHTLERDGWRFEPMQEVTYDLRCRGQATPQSKHLDCELFVEELHGGPEPTLFVDVMGTVDGLRALYCRRLGLKLVPDFPLSDREELIPCGDSSRTAVALDGVQLDYGSLLHCAIGEPAKAFGRMASTFPRTRRCPRLPGPPYHFMSRITLLASRPDHADPGGSIEAEYDIPADAWYFRDGGNGAMPFSVLLETALQPCGWLAACSGIPFRSAEDLYFRNLDGRGRVCREVWPDSGVLTTRVELRDCSTFAGATIVQFKVASSCGRESVAEWETSFGFFTRDALAQQVGLPAGPETARECENGWVRCSWREFLPEASPAGVLHTQEGRLGLLQYVTGYWPDGGKEGLGRLRAERGISASDWYFKAHFYQDPVQPGSLGLEAMSQLVRALMIRKGYAAKFTQPRFQSVALGKALQWTYRGQVVPENGTITVAADLIDVLEDERGTTGVAEGSLRVDGLEIYRASRLPVRIVEAWRGSYVTRNT